MNKKPIVYVLTFWYTTAILVLIVLFGGLTYVAISNALVSEVDQLLERNVVWVNQMYDKEIEELYDDEDHEVVTDSLILADFTENLKESIIGFDVEHVLLFDSLRTLVFDHADDHAKSVLLSAMSLPLADLPFTHEPTDTRLRFFNIQSKYFMIMGKSLEGVDSITTLILRSFAIVLPVVLIISIVGGYFLTKKTLAPVNVITNTVRTITSENLSQRVPERDVDDELGRLIKTLNAMLQKLDESFNRLLQFSSDASHELRTPFTIIRNIIDTLIREKTLDKKHLELLLKLQDEVMRSSEIVDSLLLLNKLDQKKEELHLTDFALDSLFAEISEDTEILAGTKKISVEHGRFEKVTIHADKALLRRLMLNVVDNAVKYTQTGGKITFALHKNGKSALFSVSDTGIGIPQSHIKKIFERFYRVDASRTRTSGGAGLGLAICKWIVDAHNGTIDVSSIEGQGTTVAVSLPLE